MEERRICIIGLGGGGIKITGRIVGLSSSGPLLTVINTDTPSLANSNISRKIQIGQMRTGGLGAGGDAEIGRLSVSDEIGKIKPLFEEVELLILITALGGGTGGGGAAVILEAAREMGCMTLCFATLPFTFEGEARRERADRAIEAIREHADAVIAVCNDRLFGSVSQVSIPDAFTKADEVLGAGIRAIWRLLTNPGYIHLDLADLVAVVKASGGLCSLAYGNGRGKGKARDAVTELLDSPLTDQGQLLTTARSVLVSIVGGPDLALQEIGDIMKALTARLHVECHVSMGTVIDDAWRNNIVVTILFSDQWMPDLLKEDDEKRKKPLKRPLRKSLKSGGRKKKSEQTSLSFEAAARGRFKDVEPTILDGQDFDIPTFKRRGTIIDKE